MSYINVRPASTNCSSDPNESEDEIEDESMRTNPTHATGSNSQASVDCYTIATEKQESYIHVSPTSSNCSSDSNESVDEIADEASFQQTTEESGATSSFTCAASKDDQSVEKEDLEQVTNKQVWTALQ